MRKGMMAPGKIENPVNRRVTFSRRKMGLLKKAHELSVLCDVEIAVIVFSEKGQLYEFGSPNMENTMRRYIQFRISSQHLDHKSQSIEVLQLEVHKLQKRMDSLEEINRHMIGEDINSLSLRKLHHYEKQLEKGSRRIHSTKETLLKQILKSLRKKIKPCTMTEDNGVDAGILCDAQPHREEKDEDHDSTQLMLKI